VVTSWQDLQENVRSVEVGWQRFHNGNLPVESVRPYILESWRRSLGAGVSPGQPGGLLVWDSDTLQQARLRNAELLGAAAPVLAELRLLLANTGQVVSLCDAQARALAVEGDRESCRAAERINLRPGADWSEAGSGTNAMGTALAEGRPVTVFASEHYLAGLHPWACVAAPIRHPLTGEVLGILDLSGEYMSINVHTEMAISQSVHAIVSRLALLESTYRQALFEAFADHAVRARRTTVGVIDRLGALLRWSGEARDLPSDPEGLARAAQTVIHTGQGLEFEFARGNGTKAAALFRPVHVNGAVVGALVDLADSSAAVHRPRVQPSVFEGMVGNNPAWLTALDRASRVARTQATVLVTGETGTGKELLARAVHRASPRSGRPFVAVNCGALPASLLASDLFGHVGGAFTGANPKGAPGKVEAANGGTLFLDEVSELSPEAQVHLLRVIQEREVTRVGSNHPISVDVRIVAATNQNLTDLVARGEFRQDLYFRLSVVPVHLPPLRERREDILLLIEHAYRRLGALVPDLPLTSWERLSAYDWPGNVRELLNLVEQAVVLAEDPANLLPLPQLPATPTSLTGTAGEEEQIRKALATSSGNAAAAARLLGMSRSTLYRKLEAYRIRLGRQVQ